MSSNYQWAALELTSEKSAVAIESTETAKRSWASWLLMVWFSLGVLTAFVGVGGAALGAAGIGLALTIRNRPDELRIIAWWHGLIVLFLTLMALSTETGFAERGDAVGEIAIVFWAMGLPVILLALKAAKDADR